MKRKDAMQYCALAGWTAVRVIGESKKDGAFWVKEKGSNAWGLEHSHTRKADAGSLFPYQAKAVGTW